MTETSPILPNQEPAQNVQTQVIAIPPIIKIVKAISVLVLIVGILGAFEIYDALGTIKINSGVGDGYSRSVTNPYGIILALGVLISAIITWALLRVQCLNSENLYHIRLSLEKGNDLSKSLDN